MERVVKRTGFFEAGEVLAPQEAREMLLDVASKIPLRVVDLGHLVIEAVEFPRSTTAILRCRPRREHRWWRRTAEPHQLESGSAQPCFGPEA